MRGTWKLEWSSQTADVNPFATPDSVLGGECYLTNPNPKTPREQCLEFGLYQQPRTICGPLHCTFAEGETTPVADHAAQPVADKAPVAETAI